MSSLDDRRDAFEKKFAHDEELRFRVEARACRLLGLWVAEKLSLTGTAAEDYAKQVIAANLKEKSFDDVKHKVQADLKAKHIELSGHLLDRQLEKYMEDAKQQVSAE